MRRDRLQGKVVEMFNKHQRYHSQNELIADIANLLRREHAKVVRMVKAGHKKWSAKADDLKRRKMGRLGVYHFVSGLRDAYAEILDQLQRRP